MLDLTRGLRFPHRRLDPALLEVEIEIQVVVDDPDDEAFADTWFRADTVSDGRVDEAYELSPSEVIALAVA